MVTEGRIWYIVRDNVCPGASYTSEVDKLSYLMFIQCNLKLDRSCMECPIDSNTVKHANNKVLGIAIGDLLCYKHNFPIYIR